MKFIHKIRFLMKFIHSFDRKFIKFKKLNIYVLASQPSPARFKLF